MACGLEKSFFFSSSYRNFDPKSSFEEEEKICSKENSTPRHCHCHLGDKGIQGKMSKSKKDFASKKKNSPEDNLDDPSQSGRRWFVIEQAVRSRGPL